MKVGHYLSLLETQSVLSRIRQQAIVILGLSQLMMAGLWLFSPKPVILVPPSLEVPVEIERNAASGSLKESWGLYVAELLGNITPANAGFIEKSLGPLLASAVYPEVMASVTRDLAALRADRVSIRFRALEVLYDAGRDRVFVRGETTTQGPGGPPLTQARTYEFRIRFSHYRPLIDAIEVYPGGPRTEDPATQPNPS